MSKAVVCDVCGVAKPGLPFHVTEDKTGEEWDACSATCYMDGVEGVRHDRPAAE